MLPLSWIPTRSFQNFPEFLNLRLCHSPHLHITIDLYFSISSFFFLLSLSLSFPPSIYSFLPFFSFFPLPPSFFFLFLILVLIFFLFRIFMQSNMASWVLELKSHTNMPGSQMLNAICPSNNVSSFSFSSSYFSYDINLLFVLTFLNYLWLITSHSSSI